VKKRKRKRKEDKAWAPYIGRRGVLVFERHCVPQRHLVPTNPYQPSGPEQEQHLSHPLCVGTLLAVRKGWCDVAYEETFQGKVYGRVMRVRVEDLASFSTLPDGPLVSAEEPQPSLPNRSLLN